MRVGSLFTGYGGLDMAVGGELIWYAEIEKAACQVLAAHHPGIPNLGDITAINWADVEPVDILTGGYPCQPFSHAGNRKGKNDERHLWPYVLTAIRAIRPRYAILENVSGHLSLGFDSVLTDLAQIGWAAEWGTYRASDVGAPHRRERLFIVAYADSAGLQGHNSGSGETPTTGHGHDQQGVGSPTTDTSGERHGSGKRPASVERMGGASNGSGWQASTSREVLGTGIVDDAADTDSPIGKTLTRRQRRGDAGRLQLVERGGQATADTVGKHGQLAEGRFHSELTDSNRKQRNAADTDNGHGQAIGGVSGLWGGHASRGDMPKVSADIAADNRQHPNSVINTDSGLRDGWRQEVTHVRQQLAKQSDAQPSRIGDLPRVNWGKYAPAIGRWESVLDRPAPAPTVERKDKRRLNPQFVEWMMGLPDGWVTGHGLSAAQELKMLGNGVVPQQARAAITQLMQRVEA